MRPLTLVLLIYFQSVTFGQIKLIEQTTEIWANLRGAVVNADGTITTQVGSKPALITTNQEIILNNVGNHKSISEIVRKIPTLETIELDKTTKGYQFKPGTAPGRYDILVLASDPGSSIASLIVTWPPIQPVPGPVPGPPVPDPVPNHDPDAEAARQLAVQYVHDTARDMRIQAGELRAKIYTSFEDTRTRGNALDLLNRTKFKKNIGELMNRVVKDPPSPEGFETLAKGFEAVQ